MNSQDIKNYLASVISALGAGLITGITIWSLGILYVPSIIWASTIFLFAYWVFVCIAVFFTYKLMKFDTKEESNIYVYFLIVLLILSIVITIITILSIPPSGVTPSGVTPQCVCQCLDSRSVNISIQNLNSNITQFS